MMLCILVAIISIAAPGVALWLTASIWMPRVLVRFFLTGGRTASRDRAVLLSLWAMASAAIFFSLWAWLM